MLTLCYNVQKKLDRFAPVLKTAVTLAPAIIARDGAAFQLHDIVHMHCKCKL